MKLELANMFFQIDTGQGSLRLVVAAVLVLFGNSLSAFFAAECSNTEYSEVACHIGLDTVVKLLQFLAVSSAAQGSASP